MGTVKWKYVCLATLPKVSCSRPDLPETVRKKVLPTSSFFEHLESKSMDLYVGTVGIQKIQSKC